MKRCTSLAAAKTLSYAKHQDFIVGATIEVGPGSPELVAV